MMILTISLMTLLVGLFVGATFTLYAMREVLRDIDLELEFDVLQKARKKLDGDTNET